MGRRIVEGISVEERKRRDIINAKQRARYAEVSAAKKRRVESLVEDKLNACSNRERVEEGACKDKRMKRSEHKDVVNLSIPVVLPITVPHGAGRVRVGVEAAHELCNAPIDPSIPTVDRSFIGRPNAIHVQPIASRNPATARELRQEKYAHLPEEKKATLRKNCREYSARYYKRKRDMKNAAALGSMCVDESLVSEASSNGNSKNDTGAVSVDAPLHIDSNDNNDVAESLPVSTKVAYSTVSIGNDRVTLDPLTSVNQCKVDTRVESKNDAVAFWKAQAAVMDVKRKHKPYHGFAWSKTCPHCSAPLMHDEKTGVCCNDGKYVLNRLPALPAGLKKLYSLNGFSVLSRRVNRLFCFTGLGVSGQFMSLKTPSSVAIMGRTYHQVFQTSKPSQPLHWYLHDSAERFTIATANLVPHTWVLEIGSVLSVVNPFLKSIQYMKDRHMETGLLTVNGVVDEGEVAAIIHTNNSVTIKPRSAIMWLHNDPRPVHMSILDPLYEPLQYPLLFPCGTPGWSPDNTLNLSQIDWYRCRLMQEERFLQLGRLTNEYLVDMYSRVEEERLNFIATHGYKKQGMHADLDYAEDEEGRKYILTSHHKGSVRGHPRAKGHPSFFITMTTNPNWEEIRSKLRGSQTAAEIHVIIVRSFHARLARLKSLLRTHFGKIIYMIHVVEFQKRGLPHAHIVLKVEPEVPIEAVDLIISAELPSCPEILIQVKKYMVHEHSFRCRNNGVCCWRYPKDLHDKTYIDSKGYVQYRRSKDTDLNVISYFPFLLSQLDCHINVDISATVHIFMYLYTYIYKGFDKVQYRVEVGDEEHTEVDDYVNARYMSATEAAWRILSYHITSKKLAVQCLPVHLEHGRAQSYTSRLTASKLERYFLRPPLLQFTDMTYVEYNEKYLLKPYREGAPLTAGDHLEVYFPGIARQIVHQRIRGEIVCRLRLILPHNGEIFYLRQLLMHVAARRWDDLTNILYSQ